MRFSATTTLVILVLGSPGCTTGPSVTSGLPILSTPTAPSEPTPSFAAAPPAPAAPVTAVKIGGNTTLASLGEVSKLTATATLSDGTTKDVTTDAKWSTGNPNVIAMGAPGEIRVAAFGLVYVSVSYSNKSTSTLITATPAGTFALNGRVREPGTGSVLGARVTETASHRSFMTDGNGEFSLGELPQRQANLVAEKDGYEPAALNFTFTSASNSYADLPVQRIVRLTAGQTVTPDDLAPNDLSYTVGALRCVDCRMIRVVVVEPGTLHVRATWSGGGKLTLFADGRVLADGAGELIADLPVSTSSEVLLYLGAAPPGSVNGHMRVKFETSMR